MLPSCAAPPHKSSMRTQICTGPLNMALRARFQRAGLMRSSLFPPPAARVALATRLLLSPSPLSRSAGLGSARPDRLGHTPCVVERLWRGRLRARARPCSRVSAPLEHVRQGSAPVTVTASPPPSPTQQGTGFQSSLGTLRVPAASPHPGPRLFEDLCALATPDSLNAIAGDRRDSCHGIAAAPAAASWR